MFYFLSYIWIGTFSAVKNVNNLRRMITFDKDNQTPQISREKRQMWTAFNKQKSLSIRIFLCKHLTKQFIQKCWMMQMIVKKQMISGYH